MNKKKATAKLIGNALKTQEKYQMDDDQMEQYIGPELEKRDSEYKAGVARKYGKRTYIEATKWWQSLSPKEKAQTRAESAEEVVRAYLLSDPKASSKEIGKALKPSVKNTIFDEVGPPAYDHETGRIVAGRKIKIKRSLPHQPTQKELSRMSVREIARLIEQTRDSLWPAAESSEDAEGAEAGREE